MIYLRRLFVVVLGVILGVAGHAIFCRLTRGQVHSVHNCNAATQPADNMKAPGDVVSRPTHEADPILAALRDELTSLTHSVNGMKDPLDERSRRRLLVIARSELSGLASPRMLMEALEYYPLLGEDSGRYYADAYREEVKQGNCDRAALRLALQSGGACVALLLHERLSDVHLSQEELKALKEEIGGLIPGTASMKKVPHIPELEGYAIAWLKSSLPTDKIAGAGILSGDSALRRASDLIVLLETDDDMKVRAAAALALVRTRNEDIKKKLSEYEITGAFSAYPDPDGILSRALRSAKFE